MPEEVDDVLAALDFAPRCEHRVASGPECARPATWALLSACGHSGAFCEGHRNSFALSIQSGDMVYCARHRERVLVDWAPLTVPSG